MNEQIFKICPTLEMYHRSAMSYVNNMNNIEVYRKIYKEHKEAIDRETIIYGNISHDRKKLGGDKTIHRI